MFVHLYIDNPLAKAHGLSPRTGRQPTSEPNVVFVLNVPVKTVFVMSRHFPVFLASTSTMRMVASVLLKDTTQCLR